jgi:hypothetical protein
VTATTATHKFVIVPSSANAKLHPATTRTRHVAFPFHLLRNRRWVGKNLVKSLDDWIRITLESARLVRVLQLILGIEEPKKTVYKTLWHHFIGNKMFSNLWNAVGKAVFDDVFDDQQSRDDAPALDSSSEPLRSSYSFAVPTSSSSETAFTDLSAKHSDDLAHKASSQGSKTICFTVSVTETVNTPDGLRPRPLIGDLRKALGVGDEEVAQARGKEIAADLPCSTAAQKLSFEHEQEADMLHLISAPDALDSSGSFNSDQFFSFINDEGLADDATALNDAPSRPSVDNSPYSYQFGLDTPPQDHTLLNLLAKCSLEKHERQLES